MAAPKLETDPLMIVQIALRSRAGVVQLWPGQIEQARATSFPSALVARIMLGGAWDAFWAETRWSGL